MKQKSAANIFFLFSYFLYFYQNDAFYKPFIPPFLNKKKNDYYLLNSNNELELDNINKTFNRNSFISPFLNKKKNDYYLLNSKNDLELDNTNETFNRNIRLGRSKDQDGKSNIWSVEPKMEVVNEEITDLNKNILTSGLILTGFLASLPLLYTLNQYIKNIDY
jgi:hypothetical protein